MSFVAELKRRNVFRVAVLYAVAGWMLLQVGGLLFGALDVPAWGMRLLLGLLILGFPLALIFAWVFEITPEGLKLEQDVRPGTSITERTARKMNLTIAVVLAVAVAMFAAGRYLRQPVAPATSPAAATSAGNPMTGARAPAAAAISIAVLPFVNMSDDRSNEYFSDGLTEELLNVLANVPGLRVIARTSSFAYKGKEVKIADVARDLSVDNVLEGSVRKSGNKVRITTQLIRASDSSHVWSQTYDRNLDDVFALQDEISAEVVDALKVRLLHTGPAAAETGGTQVAAAYDAYLRGRFNRNQGESEEALRAAIAAFDAAIRIDPKYARAYAGRAAALTSLGSNGYEPFQAAFGQAQESARRAVELAPDLAEAHIQVSNLLAILDFDQKASLAEVRRALQLNPGSFDVQVAYSLAAASFGRHDEAIAAARTAVELDPLSASAHGVLSLAYCSARRYGDAEAAARRAIELQPGRTGSRALRGQAQLGQQRYDEAFREFDGEPVAWQRMTGRALVYAKTGRPALARAEMQKLREQLGDAPSYQLAEISAQLGDADGAFQWLEHAHRVRDPGLVANIVTDPMLDPIRSDDRFAGVLRQAGYDTAL